MNRKYLEERQDEAIQIHGLALAVDDLMDGIRAEVSPSLSALRSVLNVLIEKADALQSKLDLVNRPKE